MHFSRREAGFSGLLGLLVASLVVTIGTFWAFEKNAPDFTVFYTAWKLVADGRGAEIYGNSPDRFLYAPGFAWLLSPLGWLPRSAALAIWCFAKAAVVGFIVREFQPLRRAHDIAPIVSAGLGAWGVALLARPLLIDFQYGQVNTLILGVCCWALLGHFSKGEGGAWDFVRWFVLGFAAIAKVFPLPLLVVPWFVAASIPRSRLRAERAGMVAGIVVTLAIPVVSLGVPGAWALLVEWRGALISRGLPFESHNQSFSALLHRWLSGELVHVVSLGMEPVRMGWNLLSGQTLRLLSLAWVAISAGALLTWLTIAKRPEPRRWVAVTAAILILPSHLVWKPYFVMFLPVGVLLAGEAMEGIQASWRKYVLFAVSFAAMNLVGFDLLGADWGARIEAASSMLWAGFAYLYLMGVGGSPQLKS